MKTQNLLIKSLSIAVIIIALLYYNTCVLNNQLEQAEADAKSAAASSQEAPETAYKDGTYEGSAQGYGGTVTCKITIKEGAISNIEVVSADGEDAAYYNQALAVLDEIASEQSADDIDTVSGATYSSNGLIGACREALAKAGEGSE